MSKEIIKENVVAAPTLFIGVGGTGCNIVKRVAEMCRPGIEAYAIMIYRIQKTYPNAEIFCLTNLERSDQRKELTHAVSQVIRDVVDLYDGVYLADIGAFSGITLDNPKYETYMPKDAGNKSLHPGAEGMKEIARVTLTSILENSKYMTGDIYDLMPEYGG